jgi:hypothetical protein
LYGSAIPPLIMVGSARIGPPSQQSPEQPGMLLTGVPTTPPSYIMPLRRAASRPKNPRFPLQQQGSQQGSETLRQPDTSPRLATVAHVARRKRFIFESSTDRSGREREKGAARGEHRSMGRVRRVARSVLAAIMRQSACPGNRLKQMNETRHPRVPGLDRVLDTCGQDGTTRPS